MDINLLPWRSNLRAQKIFYFKLQLLILLGAAVLVLLLWHIKLKQEINIVIRQTGYLQRQQVQLMKQKQEDERLQQQQQLQQQFINYTLDLEQHRAKLIQLFECIHRALPINLYFNQLIIRNHEIKIVGRAKAIADLKHFIAKIVNEKYGGIPVLQKIERQSDGYDFILAWTY